MLQITHVIYKSDSDQMQNSSLSIYAKQRGVCIYHANEHLKSYICQSYHPKKI